MQTKQRKQSMKILKSKLCHNHHLNILCHIHDLSIHTSVWITARGRNPMPRAAWSTVLKMTTPQRYSCVTFFFTCTHIIKGAETILELFSPKLPTSLTRSNLHSDALETSSRTQGTHGLQGLDHSQGWTTQNTTQLEKSLPSCHLAAGKLKCSTAARIFHPAGSFSVHLSKTFAMEHSDHKKSVSF